MAKRQWATKIFEDNGEIGFLVPDELVRALNLTVGEVLVWTMNEDNSVTINKTKIIDAK